MACDTCGHTMQLMLRTAEYKAFHCPRCGTAMVVSASRESQREVYVPKLVERCRAFRKTLGPDYMSQFASCREDWKRLGIEESIDLPEGRVP